MKWSELTTVAKVVVISIIPTMWAAWVWMFSTFETAEAASVKWANHNQAIACRTVYELEKEIGDKEAQIQFQKTLTEDDKKFLQDQIAKIQKKIDKIDPDGEC